MTNDQISPAQFHAMTASARLALRNLQRGLKYGEDMRSSAYANFLDAFLHLNLALSKTNKGVSAMNNHTHQITISLQEPQRVILEVQQGGKVWEIDVRIDTDEDGGIIAAIGRDSVLCTSCEFGWTEKHCNEAQD